MDYRSQCHNPNGSLKRGGHIGTDNDTIPPLILDAKGNVDVQKTLHIMHDVLLKVDWKLDRDYKVLSQLPCQMSKTQPVVCGEGFAEPKKQKSKFMEFFESLPPTVQVTCIFILAVLITKSDALTSILTKWIHALGAAGGPV